MSLVAALRKVQSLSCLFALFVLFIAGDLFLRLILYPLGLIVPKWRIPIISSYMRFMGASVLNTVRLGGGGFVRSGFAPTDKPALILMNHQSLLDIPIAVGVSGPYAPAFVTRRRYARFVPMVSLMLAMRRCPIVDPDTDPRGAIKTLKAAATHEERGLLIFPEGHRSRDGQIGPFNSAGVKVILREKRMPVYVVVTDGCCVGRRLFDFLSNMHRIHGRTEVLGPWDPPAADADLEAFISSLRDRMVGEIETLRRGADASV